MKFLLDMGLSPRTALVLRERGFDAIHLREQELQRLADEEIVQKALFENRIILTHDLDFGRIVSLSNHQYPSEQTMEEQCRDGVSALLFFVYTYFYDQLFSPSCKV